MALSSFALILLSCGPISPSEQPARPPAPAHSPPAHRSNATFSIRIIPAEDRTWGFAIDRDKKPFIRQLSIPTLPGNRGFASPAQATKAAELMVAKLRRGQMPPSLSRQELLDARLI